MDAWWYSEAFSRFVPYIRVQAAHDVRAGKHARLELHVPPQLAYEAADLVEACVNCGSPMHPFRVRRAPAKRGKASERMYLAVSCPLNTSIGCARGAAASSAYDQIESLAGFR